MGGVHQTHSARSENAEAIIWVDGVHSTLNRESMGKGKRYIEYPVQQRIVRFDAI